MELDSAIRAQLDELVNKHRVVLFMKGTKSFPQCGFSSAVVNILKEVGVKFETANVLADPKVRDGIKVYSDWPTIPQLYIDGKFVGGCDIIREMHATGELSSLLGVKVDPPKPPTLTISDSAAKAFKDAAEPGEDRLRLEIDPGFRVELYFGPPRPGDLEVIANGVAVLVDPASSKRADGVTIDYVDGPDGEGFKIENPNAPATVKQLSANELAAWMKKETVRVFDVRTETERKQASIEGTVFLADAAGRALLEGLDKNTPIVFMCHHGGRSQRAAEHAVEQGYKRVHNLAGGIDAWSKTVDESIPRY